ncbi:MAG TPA: hypothetical protein VJJ72_01185 [Candidatus Paceibacterota bacterium]
MKYILPCLMIISILLNVSPAFATVIPPGRAITLDEVDGLIRLIARFLIVISIVIAIIAFVLSGITYMMGGTFTDVKKAQAMFKNTLWGTTIILAIGVIINTIAAIVSREFFYCDLRILGVCVW